MPSPRSGGVTARKLQIALFLFACPQGKIKKKKNVNLKLCGKLQHDLQFHACGKMLRNRKLDRKNKSRVIKTWADILVILFPDVSERKRKQQLFIAHMFGSQEVFKPF